MSIDEKVLEIVSNETKTSIDQMSVVTPSVYASIFAKFAKENGLKIQDEENLSKELLNSECLKLTTLQQETSKNVQTLSENTTKAINAIANKDGKMLNEVLQETKLLRHEIEKLKESVYKDELTHAYNRKWLRDTYLDKLGNIFIKNGTLAILDLNYFKQINDTHGHIIGDKVLLFITNELKKLKVPVVRYGGDEFILFFKENIPKQEVLSILHKAREQIINKKLKAHNDTFRVSFSFGITEFQANNEFITTIENADKNMYKDKIEIKKRVTSI